MKYKTCIVAFTLSALGAGFASSAVIVGAGVNNGGFESDSGKQADWTGVTSWTENLAAGSDLLSSDPGDSGSDGTGNGTGTASEVLGDREAFINNGSTAYNDSTTHTIAVGDVIDFSFYFANAGRGPAFAAIAGVDGSGVITTFGTQLDVATGTEATFSGSQYTVTAADTAVLGQTLTIVIGSAGNYPEIDNVTLEVTSVPEPTSTALLGLGGLALLMRRRK